VQPSSEAVCRQYFNANLDKINSLVVKKMPKPRLAGARLGFLEALPVVGDVFAIATELANPEASPAQRFVNAGIVGGGGLLVSGATKGLDVIPQTVDTVNILRGGPKGPEKLKQMQACATIMNPDNHLRALATKLGPDKYNNFYETDFVRAAGQCGESIIPSQYKTEEEKTKYLQYLGSKMGHML
jgi:hypothetical protein